MAIRVAVPSGGVVDLSSVDVSRLYEGTLLNAIESDDSFQLVVSSAVVDHVDVESVKDNATMRWVKFVGGGGDIALPDYSVYVDPAGDDDGTGTVSDPFATLYVAFADVIEKGGGTVNSANNCLVGGPVEDQGLWLRNDGIEVPGFLDMEDRRIRWVAHGNQSSQFVFEPPGCARFIGGGGCEKPGLWIVGSEVPIDICYVKSFNPPFSGQRAPVRIGWDFMRKDDFTLEEIPVLNAERFGDFQITTLSLDLSECTQFQITHAARTSNVVTLWYQCPATIALSPWNQGSPIRVDTSNANFPDIDAIVTAQSDILPRQGVTEQTVTYTQAGSNFAKEVCTGTIISHGCFVGDKIYLKSSNAEFPTCSMMRVTAVTIDSINVFDPYGYSPRSFDADEDDIGTIVKQVRGRSVASGVTLDTCSFFGAASAGDDFQACPTIDYGGSSANIMTLNRCYVGGGNVWSWDSLPDNVDFDRTMVSVLADPGGGTASGATLVANNCQSQSGGIRFNPQGTEATIRVTRWLQDSGGLAPATVACGDGSVLASIHLDQIANADSDVPAISIGTGYDPLKVFVGEVFSSNQTPVQSESYVNGPTNMRSAYWNASDTPTASPWELGWRTTWTGGLAIPHVGANRTLGVVQTRFANLFPAITAWPALPTGITVTQDGLAPDGSSTAIKIVATGSFVDTSIPVISAGSPATFGASVGDYLALGLWINAPGLVGLTAVMNAASIQIDSGPGVLRAARHIATSGWQWCVIYGKITTVSVDAYTIAMSLPAGAGTYYMYGPTLVLAPASIGAADFYEYANTLKHQPIYSSAGTVGTMEGIKLIAHGGMGINGSIAKAAGGGSGQLTLTGSGTVYEPRYGSDGSTIIGWVALLQATVNP